MYSPKIVLFYTTYLMTVQNQNFLIFVHNTNLPVVYILDRTVIQNSDTLNLHRELYWCIIQKQVVIVGKIFKKVAISGFSRDIILSNAYHHRVEGDLLQGSCPERRITCRDGAPYVLALVITGYS
jgi:hypothetical protein